MSAYETAENKQARLERERAKRKQERATPYNGWTNIGTWRVALVLDNDEPSYNWMQRKIAYAVRYAERLGGALNAYHRREIAEKRLAGIIMRGVRHDTIPFDDPAIMRSELRLALREGGINWREIAAGELAGESFEGEPPASRIVMPESRDPMDDSDYGCDAWDAYYDRLVD